MIFNLIHSSQGFIKRYKCGSQHEANKGQEMKCFTQIKGYKGHSFYNSNYNTKNNGLILQININGLLVNCCVLSTKNNPHIRYKKVKYKVAMI